MTYRRLLKVFACASVLVLFCGSGNNLHAQLRNAQQQRNKTRSQLIDENIRMQDILDSLELVIKNMNRQKHLDSLSVQQQPTHSKDHKGHGPSDFAADKTDSLLSIYYEQKMIERNKEGENYDMDNVHFTSNVPDKVLIERLEKMNSYITLPFNETVRNYIVLYSEKMPTKLPRILGLCSYYMPIFEEVFNRYGLPEELKVMAVIESALNPVAVSRANAKGMWQFMHTTAKSYGLRIDSYVDERFDTYKAADAAARYLRDAYNIFGDWNLAISSYNCGAGNVNKAIRRAGGKTDFWSIYNYLPKETRGYVPAFVGAMYALTYYREYGIKPDAIELPAAVDTFEIKKMLHFKQINDLVGVPLQTLSDLNPQYIHDVIPGGGETFVLRIPYKYSSEFIAHEDSIYTYKASEYLAPATLLASSGSGSSKVTANGMIETRTAYKVKSGDTLGKIASRNKTTVANLKKWNNLKSDNLRVGQVIYLVKYTPAPTPAPAPEPKVETPPQKTDSMAIAIGSNLDSLATAASPVDSVSTTAAVDSAPKADTTKAATTTTQPKSSSSTELVYTMYTVKSGDTLYKISQKYPGVSADEIMKYNKLKNSNIQVGQKLKIPKK